MRTFNEIRKIKQIKKALRSTFSDKKWGRLEKEWTDYVDSYYINPNPENEVITIFINENHYRWLAREEAMESLPKSSLATFP